MSLPCAYVVQCTARELGRFINKIWDYSSLTILIFLFSSYFQTSTVALNSVLWLFWPETLWVFIRILYTACSIPFPSSRCQLFTTFDCSFQSPLPLGFFAFSLQFIVVACRSVGLAGASLAIPETKIYVVLMESIQCISDLSSL